MTPIEAWGAPRERKTVCRPKQRTGRVHWRMKSGGGVGSGDLEGGV
jgi:hypothetical protein